MADTLTLLAPAKINLYLHVGAVQADGYHPLDSLVAFADLGDRISVRHAPTFSFEMTGPFAQGLENDADNLVVRALLALADHLGRDDLPMAVELDKRLPVAAGLGGGSSDAGAALRGANLLLDLNLSDEVLERIARAAGADGPMCYRARPAIASGIGEQLEEADFLPSLHAVLLNPGLPSPTGAVYRAYDERGEGAADRPALPSDLSMPSIIDWLSQQRNDLQAPSVDVTPQIVEAIEALSAIDSCRMVRMSGSGATIFGLFDTAQDALDAAMALDRTGWWVRPTVLGAPQLLLA